MRHTLDTRSRLVAFTLIELLISIGLGTVIVLTSMAGLRMAAQTTSMANRLSLENAMLREGILSSLEQVDFWTQYDDPEDPGAQRLRAVDGARELGLPFSPLKNAWPKDRPNLSSPTLFEPDAKKWSFHDPETWWRGCAAERYNTDLRFGRYAIFACATSPATIASPGKGVYTTGLGIPNTWLFCQMRGIERALGWYGRTEYVPTAAQMTAFYDEFVAGGALQSSQGGLPMYLLKGSWPHDGYRFLDPYYPHYFPNTHDAGSYSVFPVTDTTSAWTTVQMVDAHRRCYSTDYLAAPASVAQFTNLALTRTPLLRDRPDFWPEVRVSVLQSYKMLRFHALCKVQWNSPVTGVQSELSFSAFGTSLRGARQQRRQDAGWAAPGDPTLDTP
jgi:type II secretory pathway pseudopilin PulG